MIDTKTNGYNEPLEHHIITAHMRMYRKARLARVKSIMAEFGVDNLTDSLERASHYLEGCFWRQFRYKRQRMIPEYLKKQVYIYERQYGRCAICGHIILIGEYLELHHRCHKAVFRYKKYPLFMDSTLNLVMVHKKCREENRSWGNITDYRAERIERFLERHPIISNKVNMVK